MNMKRFKIKKSFLGLLLIAVTYSVSLSACALQPRELKVEFESKDFTWQGSPTPAPPGAQCSQIGSLEIQILDGIGKVLVTSKLDSGQVHMLKTEVGTGVWCQMTTSLQIPKPNGAYEVKFISESEQTSEYFTYEELSSRQWLLKVINGPKLKFDPPK